MLRVLTIMQAQRHPILSGRALTNCDNTQCHHVVKTPTLLAAEILVGLPPPFQNSTWCWLRSIRPAMPSSCSAKQNMVSRASPQSCKCDNAHNCIVFNSHVPYPLAERELKLMVRRRAARPRRQFSSPILPKRASERLPRRQRGF